MYANKYKNAPLAAPRRHFLRMVGAGMGAMTLTLVGCGGGEGADPVARLDSTACVATVWGLVDTQSEKVGTVTVSNTATDLVVAYSLFKPGATFGNLHMWAGKDFSTLSGGGTSFPLVGQLPHQADATGQTTYTFTIPLGSLGITTCEPVSLHVVTHADIRNGDGSADTAFGGPTAGPGDALWYYGTYTLCCDTVEPPPQEYREETAYAKGSNTFIDLKIGKNWGWAIELKAPGVSSYDIWAGAGQNDTTKGTRVGTLTVDWSGSQVTLTYALTGGARMSEAHVYVGDQRPTTTAPGKYGNTFSFDPWTSTHSVTLPLADSGDADGVWLVAHAVVNIPV